MSGPTTSLTRTGTTGGSTGRTSTGRARRPGRVARAVGGVGVAAARLRDAAGAASGWVAGTVTPAGWLVAVFAVAGMTGGWVLGWIEWLVGGLIAAVLLAMCIPFLFGARGYDVSLRLAHARVVAGSSVDGEIAIRNVTRRALLPGRIDLPVGDGLVELGVPLLRAGHVVMQPVTIPAVRRGIVRVGPATAVRQDPVGLLRREHQWEGVQELYVHPRTVALPPTSGGLVHDLEGNPTRRVVDADISFHALREYAPGDSPRRVHWKSTAKTGRLMVRQFEQTLRSSLAVVLGLDRAEYLDDDEFELAVSVSASLSLQAARDGRDVTVVAGTGSSVLRGGMPVPHVLPTITPRVLLDGYARIAATDRDAPVETVARATADAVDAPALAVLVVGSTVSLARLQHAATSFAADTAVLAVVCDELAVPRVRTTGPMTVLSVAVLGDLAGLLLRGAQTGAST